RPRWVRLEVTDTGTGMAPEVAARAFEPFFTTKPKQHGTGLGLATVYGIVTRAGGDISVESAPGQGTTVRIELPGTAKETQPSAGPTAGAGPDTAGQTVLLVEDDDPVREVARRILAGAGYHVVAAAGGAEALRICREPAVVVDLVLTDVMMPGMSG